MTRRQLLRQGFGHHVLWSDEGDAHPSQLVKEVACLLPEARCPAFDLVLLVRGDREVLHSPSTEDEPSEAAPDDIERSADVGGAHVVGDAVWKCTIRRERLEGADWDVKAKNERYHGFGDRLHAGIGITLADAKEWRHSTIIAS